MMNSLSALGVSPRKEKQFNRKGIYTAEDLLRFFPKKYLDFSKETGILAESEISTFTAKCIKVSMANKKVPITRAVVLLSDGTYVACTWFNQNYMYHKIYALRGKEVFVAGKIKFDPFYNSYSTTPIVFDELKNKEEVGVVYSKIQGMSDEYFHQTLNSVLFDYAEDITDPLPKGKAESLGYIGEGTAFLNAHYPTCIKDAEKAVERITFDELCDFAGATYWKEKSSSIGSPFSAKTLGLFNKVKESLPYELTEDQKGVIKQLLAIQKDGKRINALVQGDVGCGKSIVAFLLMAAFSGSGFQSVLMAPTKVLATQHYEDLKGIFEPLGYEIGFLYSGMKTREKKAVLKKIASGDIKIIVGTHAVVADDAIYKDLALVITDEEHKFGVAQRARLCEKASLGVHSMSMSATPIPRSLASVLYGFGTEVLTISTMPNGRKPVMTGIGRDREKIYRFLIGQVKKGHQAYIVCPMIDENENLDALSVEEVSKEYTKALSPHGIRIATLTGKDDKKVAEDTISAFKNGDIDILISTTVIEVGVNVPNATAMVITSAERFGLSSLHQLRGRVGRSSYQSYCVLETTKASEKAIERLNVLCETNDGYKIAEADLSMRGAGDVFGERQSGQNRYLNLMLKYPKVYADAQKVARDIIYNGIPCPLLDKVMLNENSLHEEEVS